MAAPANLTIIDGQYRISGIIDNRTDTLAQVSSNILLYCIITGYIFESFISLYQLKLDLEAYSLI